MRGPWRAAWLLFLLIAQGRAIRPQPCRQWPSERRPQLYGYEVAAEFPHDPKAFTQGLVFDRRCYDNKTDCREVFWESTGMYGDSDVRLVHVDSGRVERRTPMASKWFGEGLVKVGDRLYQITWQGPNGFVYSTQDLKQVGTFRTPLKDGWGATSDGRLIVLSDGSADLTWVDPADGFKRVRTVTVRDGERPVRYLNELEWVEGEIWANVWQRACIARVCPETGRVTGWLLLHGLAEALQRRNLPMQGRSMDVLNGIAWDSVRRRLFVTGKYWPRVFEVVPKLLDTSDPNIGPLARQAVESCFV